MRGGVAGKGVSRRALLGCRWPVVVRTNGKNCAAGKPGRWRALMALAGRHLLQARAPSGIRFRRSGIRVVPGCVFSWSPALRVVLLGCRDGQPSHIAYLLVMAWLFGMARG